MRHEFDDENDDGDTISDAEPRQVSEGEKKVGFFRGLLRKLSGSMSAEKVANTNELNPSEAENNETLSEAELVAKINALRNKCDDLIQKLDRLWPVIYRDQDSSPCITRDMKRASEKAEEAKFELKKACEDLRKINPNNPILATK